MHNLYILYMYIYVVICVYIYHILYVYVYIQKFQVATYEYGTEGVQGMKKDFGSLGDIDK